MAVALMRGLAAKRDWVSSGEVVLLAELAERWGCKPESLAGASAQGDTFTVEVEGLSYAPAEFLGLDATVVAAICQELGAMTDTEKLVFWKRDHGALGGKSVLSCLKTEGELGLGRVLQLARTHAREGAPVASRACCLLGSSQRNRGGGGSAARGVEDLLTGFGPAMRWSCGTVRPETACRMF